MHPNVQVPNILHLNSIFFIDTFMTTLNFIKLETLKLENLNSFIAKIIYVKPLREL